MAEPVVKPVGEPRVIFDSRQGPRPGYISETWTAFKKHLMVAWTAEPPKPLDPSNIRLVFVTTDNKEGFRDYELRQWELVETAWRSLAEDENVSYAYVVVYSGRNPYEANFSKAIYDYKDPNLFHQDRKDRSIFPSDDAEPKTRTKTGPLGDRYWSNSTTS
ncbi:hypothetical protein H2203_007115 [Taxawa tesnikishii (nom. ined.)]|nr:hypothetical protein H2203_007115 [Dothideales sp. JES 119]